MDEGEAGDVTDETSARVVSLVIFCDNARSGTNGVALGSVFVSDRIVSATALSSGIFYVSRTFHMWLCHIRGRNRC
jgi:hypothetical protein